MDIVDDTVLRAAADSLGDDLRSLGLYEEHTDTVTMHGQQMVIMNLLIGDVAFSDRVQRPDVADIDGRFNEMTEEIESFESIRQRLREGGELF